MVFGFLKKQLIDVIEWPDEITMDAATRAQVDARWTELFGQ